jgi:hypothetical protein
LSDVTVKLRGRPFIGMISAREERGLARISASSASSCLAAPARDVCAFRVLARVLALSPPLASPSLRPARFAFTAPASAQFWPPNALIVREMRSGNEPATKNAAASAAVSLKE